MLLRIQPEESLRSYVERNLYLKLNRAQLNSFAKLSKSFLVSQAAVTIASAIDWHGCFGFNRLIHNHTDYFIHAMFKDVQDISYSDNLYITDRHLFGSDITTISFCPECVKSDVEKHGFSYWRRAHSNNLKVCAVHNICLMDHCPFCGLPFSRDGHGLDVMWARCRGQHLAEATAISNTSAEELKRARFYSEASEFGYHIDVEAALTAVRGRLEHVLSIENSISGESIKSYNEISRLLSVIVKNRLDSQGQFSRCSPEIYNALRVAYPSFDSFLRDIPLETRSFKPVDSMWDTYLSSKYYVSHYVQEDYERGLGIWKRPFAQSSARDFDIQFLCRRMFRCCNTESKNGVWPRARSDGTVFPKTPCLSLRTSIKT